MSKAAIEAALAAQFDPVNLAGVPITPAQTYDKMAQAIYAGSFDMDAMWHRKRSSNLSLTNLSETAINFDTVNAAYSVRTSIFSYNSGNGRITVSENGFYEVRFQVSFAQNGSGTRRAHLITNELGTDQRELSIELATGGVAVYTQFCGSKIVPLNAGRYVYIAAVHDSGGPLDLNGNASSDANSSWIQIRKVAPR